MEKKFYKELNQILKTNKVKYFQLRLKKISDHNLLKIAKKIKKITKKNNVKFLINDRPLIAKKVSADGCHIGQKDMDFKSSRKILGKNKIIGMTCHNSKKLALIAKKLGANNVFVYSSNQDKFLEDVKKEYGLFDAAIVFAPVDEVTDTAIKSIKKGGLVVIATVGKIPNFLAFEEKTIRGTLIGSRKDMEDVIRISDENNLEVVTETFPLEQANEALIKLKNSEIDARAVLIP